MSRVHDMGGQTGFGPVPAEDDGKFFHADWEARVYAIIRVLQRRGVVNAAFDDLRDAIERIRPVPPIPGGAQPFRQCACPRADYLVLRSWIAGRATLTEA